MEYKILVEKIESVISRNVPEAAEDLSRQVNAEIARGWEPLGGISIGSAGTAPYLVQALVKR